VGTYQVVANADQYLQGQTAPFAVGEGEARDVGDLPLQPNPFHFSEITPCDNLPPTGGACSYSIKITNASGTLLDGAVWSIVNGWGIGSLIDYTNFQTAKPQQLTLRPGQSRVVKFEFQVPSTVRDYGYMCADVWAGQNRLYPFFNTVVNHEGWLFCIEKQPAGAFSVVPEKKAQKLFQQLNRRP